MKVGQVSNDHAGFTIATERPKKNRALALLQWYTCR